MSNISKIAYTMPISTLYLSALDFWHSLVFKFEFDELEFYCMCSLVACKNPVHETQNFKLEIVKMKFR